MQQYAGIYLLQNHSTCFGCPSHPSSGVHKTVTAVSGTGHSIWATTFLHRGLIRPRWRKVVACWILLIYFYSITFFENRAVCEIIWKNTVKPGRPQMTVRCMRIACWITTATNTHRFYNTNCFSTATVVARTFLSDTLYVHCLSCLINPDFLNLKAYVRTVLLIVCTEYWPSVFSFLFCTVNSANNRNARDQKFFRCRQVPFNL